MIGRLIGANEMAVALLKQEAGSPTGRKVAEVLERTCSYFMEDVRATSIAVGETGARS